MIEYLEARIAPATLTGRVVKYTDLDGDVVTVKLTAGTLAEGNFVFNNAFGSTGPQELQRIDVSGVADVDGSKITVVVKKGTVGDGIANIGAIVATGHDLGAVKMKGHLGAINAGTNAQPAPGLASLSVGSLGVAGTSAQAPGGSTIAGAVGSVKIVGDLGDSFGATSVGTVKVGGSLIGDGRLFIDGAASKLVIAGSIQGDPSESEIDIYVRGQLGSLTVGGSVFGGVITSNISTPQILIEGATDRITIGGDIRGATGTFPQQSVRVDGTVGAFTVGGSIIGADGIGAIIRLADKANAFGQGVDSVVIGGSMVNTLLGVSLSFTNSQSRLDAITIGGSFISSGIAVSGTFGADQKFGTADDNIAPASVLGRLTIKGPVYGTAASGDSFAVNAGKVEKAKIGARVLPLGGGTQTLTVAPSGDVFIRDLV